MSLKQQIDRDLKVAIRAQNKDEIRALRGIKSMILLAETEKGVTGDLSEDAEIKLLSKAAKQRRDSARLYSDQNREDLAVVENAELEIISKYLPEQISEEELVDHINKIISKIGAAGPQDMGKVMGAANKELKGKADGGTIAKVVKGILIK